MGMESLGRPGPRRQKYVLKQGQYLPSRLDTEKTTVRLVNDAAAHHPAVMSCWAAADRRFPFIRTSTNATNGCWNRLLVTFSHPVIIM
jgi:hypothetical protein